MQENVSSLIKWTRLDSENDSKNREALLSYRDSMISFGASVSNSNTQIDGMKEAIFGLANQRISRAMNRACTKAVRSLENIINTMDALEGFVQNTVELIDEKLEAVELSFAIS